MPVNLAAPNPADLHPVPGVRVGIAMAGVRKANRKDLVAFVLDAGTLVAGVFTQNRFCAAPVQVSESSDGGRVITVQLWHWHEDGERYDQEHFQLVPGDGDDWAVHVRRTTSWALTRSQLTEFVTAAGFVDVRWHDPAAGGFYQPVLTARAAG
jgi:hypothetical protein